MRSFFLASVLLAGGCAGGHAPYLSGDPPDASLAETSRSAVEVGGFRVDVAVDSAVAPVNCGVALEAGSCACAEIGQKPTSLYVVLDRSGSMLEIVPPSVTSKWDTVRLALLGSNKGVLRSFGGRLRVGVAVYPSIRDNACSVGEELFAPQVGSAAVYDRIATALQTLPNGGTPTAATLTALAAKVKAMPQPAFVLLATDGAPNCNSALRCAPDRCSYNIEKLMAGPRACNSTFNCCDPSLVSGGLEWKACVDDGATVAAIEALAKDGIKTFVLGVPGVEAYADVLNAMAIAGGAPRAATDPASARYYAPLDASQDSLQAALAAIAAQMLDACTIDLQQPPEKRGETNVLVDGQPVAYDPLNGWQWTDNGQIKLLGTTCDRIVGGTVAGLQVVVGCPTVTY